MQPAYAALKFLTISDIHYGSENKSQMGQDIGPDFLKIALHQFKKLSNQVDFILFLGDIPTHLIFLSRHKKEYETTVFHELYQNDSGKPMFYISGNNDSLGGNYQPFESHGITPLTFATDWEGACAYCNKLMIDDSHMYHEGYYSTYVIPQNREIILIALNATQWAKTPWFLNYSNQKKDALNQLSWLEQQLKKHRAKQLLIALHEPPGNSYLGTSIWQPLYLKKFIQILAQYNHLYGQITLLTSHTHREEFRKIHLGKSVNLYAYSTPSISPIRHNYPAMKIFSLNHDMKIKDFTTYYTTSLQHWSNQQYHALSTPDPIFPNCHTKALAQCMDQLNKKQICDDLHRGSFYGVKNPKVSDISCQNTYFINYSELSLK